MSETRSCRDCPETYEMDANQAEWYLERGWKLPKSCPPCRKKKKDAAAAMFGKKNLNEPDGDKIAGERKCHVCGNFFRVSYKDAAFYIRKSEELGNRSRGTPSLPRLCSKCTAWAQLQKN